MKMTKKKHRLAKLTKRGANADDDDGDASVNDGDDGTFYVMQRTVSDFFGICECVFSGRGAECHFLFVIIRCRLIIYNVTVMCVCDYFSVHT